MGNFVDDRIYRDERLYLSARLVLPLDHEDAPAAATLLVRWLTEHTVGINKADQQSFYAITAISTPRGSEEHEAGYRTAVWMCRHDFTGARVRTIPRRSIWVLLI
jgi:hypothetical protein